MMSEDIRIRSHAMRFSLRAKTGSICCLLAVLTFASHAAGSGGPLADRSIAWNWRVAQGRLRPVSVEDKLNGETLPLTGDCFELVFGDGTVLKSSDFRLEGSPKILALKRDSAAPKLALHFPGKELVAHFAAPENHLYAVWGVRLRRGATYLRQRLALRAEGADVRIRQIVLFHQKVPGARTAGTVEESPVVAGDFFFGYEQPVSQNTVDSNDVVRCAFARNAVLKDGETLTQSCVVGVVPHGQLRRGFLAYLERERPRPYPPFLHYNSWYDISWVNRKYNQTEAVNAINQIGRELVRRRGVKLNSFLFDDGWDNNRTLWKFNRGFPHGFTPLKRAAAKYGAGIGVWLSPWGGYGQPREQRLAYGVREEFETNAYGFSLPGPKYYRRFCDICLTMIRRYGVNTFKFNGLAAGANASEHSLTRDGDAMLRLIANLRAAEPTLYINQTSGTWPSLFWLLYVDSTWRGGYDDSFLGKDSWCQRWMTYRDAQTHHNVVVGAPLYPLNSLMLHGIIYARHADHLERMSDADFADQVRAYFVNGTQLQELYVTPSLLDSQNWNGLAEAAKWARANAAIPGDYDQPGVAFDLHRTYGFQSGSKEDLALRSKQVVYVISIVWRLPSMGRNGEQQRSRSS